MSTTLTADLCAALDPVAFAMRAGLPDLDLWQERALRSTSARVMFNCSRQSGKSTISAVLATHKAVYEDGALVLLLSPTLRQSQELFKKCIATFRGAGSPVGIEGETALTLTLANGSRIVSLPGKEETIRGYSGVRLLIIDEAARVKGDLYASVRPMLAVSGGRLVALSTPFGTRGWWYEEWERGTWERYKVPATECPRIRPGFLEEERRSLGEWWFRQEYMCEFMDAQSQAFTRAEVDAAFEEEVEIWAL